MTKAPKLTETLAEEFERLVREFRTAPPSGDRQSVRSRTPQGFARAVFAANHRGDATRYEKGRSEGDKYDGPCGCEIYETCPRCVTNA